MVSGRVPRSATRRLAAARSALRLLAIGLGAAVLAPEVAHADRSALWRIVHEDCVPHARAQDLPPGPCDAVDLTGGILRGVAFLKDRVGVAQMLAIPTRPVSGIEEPDLLLDGAADYFAMAWRDGWPLVERHLGRAIPREDLGLAINAQSRRSQDQFHIHVDCLDPQVAATLAAQAAGLGDTWRPLPAPLKGRIYWARRLAGDAIDRNPLRLVADGIPGARAHMGDWSLAVVGATLDGRPGFILLADAAGLLAGGHAEDLQDHSCAGVAKP